MSRLVLSWTLQCRTSRDILCCRHWALLRCEMPWPPMSPISCEVLFPSSPSVMVHVTILHPASKPHSHLGGKGELVQPSKEQKTDCRSPKPLVGPPYTGSSSFWFHVAYTEPASAPRLMSPAAKSCKFLKKSGGVSPSWFFFFFLLFGYISQIFFRLLLLPLKHTVCFGRNKRFFFFM